jgi:hypothetical protein
MWFQFIEGLNVIVKMNARWKIPHRLQTYLIEGFKTGDQHDIQRDEVENCHQDQWDQQQVARLKPSTLAGG